MGIAYNTSLTNNGLVYYFDAANPRCYSGSGTSIYDLTAGIGVSLVGGVGFGSTNNGYFIFDGTNDYIPLGSLGTFYNQGTISFWMKPSDVSVSIRNPFSTNYGNSNNTNVIRFETAELSGSLRVWFGDGSNNVSGLNYSDITSNVWYNVAVSWNQSTTTVIGFLNGNLNASNSSWTRWPTSFANVGIGLGYQTRYFQGNISNVSIYNKALSNAEIKQNYNALKKRYGL